MTLREQGTAWYVDVALAFNDLSIRYFQDMEFADAEQISAKRLESLLVGRRACHSCPIGCGRRVSLPSSGFRNIAGPEYQSIASLGSNLLIGDLEKISVMNHLCNEYGMDTISCGNTIALATYLDEVGKSQYGLHWGDASSTISLIHSIARREGIGNVFAEGAYRVGKKHNAEDLVLHVHGLEVPNHDPRSFFGMATVYTMASRGATHLEGDMYSVDLGTDVESLGIIGTDRLTNEGKGTTAARAQDFRAFYDSLILCHFATFPVSDIVALVNLAVGTKLTTSDILRIGARAVTQKRLLNLELGLDSGNEKLPTGLVAPHPDSITSDLRPDVARQLDDYYDYRKWDRKTGKPTWQALHDLGLA
jgi:aldehyde:ferredoxin oxidoreductase